MWNKKKNQGRNLPYKHMQVIIYPIKGMQPE